ncbi:MAG: Silent information regulator protein Sir2 [Chitinophagaceae bacterium]|nr:Silent information regulator protein Sir2 [Chitinophagaceae bacterium]
MKKNVVVLSGAGISAESGIKTFRDSGGLWEGYDVTEVATPEGFRRNPELVLEFYNMRRKQAMDAKPNAGHLALVELEKQYHVNIITQNVDNLHEKAGSSHVLHLHGELFKSRSTRRPSLIYDMNGWELKIGDTCELGAQLRPHIVWFGEAVPAMDEAIALVRKADVLIIVGTSMQVYPAAGLIDYAPQGIPVYVVDPNLPAVSGRPNLHLMAEPASTGLTKVVAKLMKN